MKPAFYLSYDCSFQHKGRDTHHTLTGSGESPKPFSGSFREHTCCLKEVQAYTFRLLFLGSKITADSDCSHEIKRRFLLRRKAMTNLARQHIKTQRHYFVSKGPSSQSYGFSQ